jgi:hypothetical protein
VCRHTAFHLRQLVAGLWSSSLSLGLGHCWLTLGACPFCRAPHPPLTVGIGARPHVLGVQLGACPKSPGTRSLPSFSTVPRGPDETLDSCAVRASREDSFSLECLASDITVLTRPRRTLYLGEEEPPPRDALRPPPPGSLTPSTVFLQRGLRILQRSRTRFTTFLGRLGSSFHRRRWTRVRLESLPPDRSPSTTADEAPFPSCFTPLEECHPHPAPSPSPPNRSSMFTDVATLVTLRRQVPLASVGSRWAPSSGSCSACGTEPRSGVAAGLPKPSSSMGFWFPFEACRATSAGSHSHPRVAADPARCSQQQASVRLSASPHRER